MQRDGTFPGFLRRSVTASCSAARAVVRLVVVPVLFVMCLPESLHAQAISTYQARLAFRPPPSPSEVVLVRFVTNDALCAAFKAFRVEDGSGLLQPSRVVLTTSNSVILLVYTGGAGSRGSEFYVYGVDSAKAQTESPVWTNDLLRVGVTVRHRASPTLPNAWDRFLYFWERSTSGASSGFEPEMEIDDFDAMMVRLSEQQPAALVPASGARTWRDRRAIDDGKKAAWRANYGRPAILVRMESQVRFPEDGEYRLALSCRDSGYILVDGELALAVESGGTPTTWQIGDARRYQAGIHSVEVMTGSLVPSVRIGWSPPGTSGIAPLGTVPLLAPGPIVDGRFEVRGQFIHASFTHTMLEPYKFRDLAGTFFPMRFTDTSRNPGGAMLTRTWVVEGRAVQGASAVHTFTGPGPYPVHLSLNDSLGATGECERVVDVRARVVQEYAVDFEVGGLPPACLVGDSLSPYLVSWGKGPAGVGFDVAWSFRDARTNEVSGGVTNITLLGPAVKVDLGKQEIRDIRTLEWAVRVAGKTIKGGSVAFDATPFAAWPESVVADRLYGPKGTRTVLVSSLERCDEDYGELENGPPASGPVVLLDDTLVPYTVPGEARETYAGILPRLLEGARDVRYASLAPAEEGGGSLKTLAKFVALPKLAGDAAGRTVVLSTGVQDLLLGGDVESFERGLAVMVDKLMADKVAVVLVTPPPYPGMETRLRRWAVAVRRVGDARGLAVVDLYTAFIGLRHTGGPFFELDTLGLTARGHRLAADRIAKTLGKGGK